MPPKNTKTTPRAAVKKGAAVAGSSKRKAIFISDGSTSEVDRTALLPSPSKKAKVANALHAPGGTDFEDAPAVSIATASGIVQEALQLSEPNVRRKLSFGSLIPGGEDHLEPPAHHGDRPAGITSPTRPARTKVPTEKALFSDSLRKSKPKKTIVPASSDSNLPASVIITPPPAPLHPALLSPEVPEPPATPTLGGRSITAGNASTGTSPSSPPVSMSRRATRIRKQPTFRAAIPSPPSRDISPSVTPPPVPNAHRSMHVGKRGAPTPPPLPALTVVTPRSTRSHKQEVVTHDSPGSPAITPKSNIAALFDDAAESGEETTLSAEETAELEEAALSPGEEGSALEDKGGDDGDEGSGTSTELSPQSIHAAVAQDTVMCESLQDPHLRAYYVGLPFLDHVCDVQSYPDGSGGSQPAFARAEFSTLAEVIPHSSTKSVTKGLLFDSCGFFVNTARIHPKLLTNDGGRLKITIGGRLVNAVGIMLGVTTECLLRDTGTYGSVNTYNVHRVTIAPFKQEWRRDVAVWGKILNFTLITGSHTHLGVSFTTRKQSGSSSAVQQMNRPVGTGTSSILTSVTSPLSTAKENRTLIPYPASRGFHEQIPIYDGRARSGHHFMFSNEDFQSLTQMPLYHGGNVDLPPESVVAVGYTLGTFPGASGPALSSNIQFVILLGIPTSS